MKNNAGKLVHLPFCYPFVSLIISAPFQMFKKKHQLDVLKKHLLKNELPSFRLAQWSPSLSFANDLQTNLKVHEKTGSRSVGHIFCKSLPSPPLGGIKLPNSKTSGMRIKWGFQLQLLENNCCKSTCSSF